MLALLATRADDGLTILGLTLITAVLVLGAAAATPLLTLPVATVIMVALVVLLLAYHLARGGRPQAA